MKVLFIITGSIAIKKCEKILKELTKRKIKIDCIITENAKKMIKEEIIKKSITGGIYYNSSEKKNKMLHIKLTRKCNLVVVCPATANIIAKFSNGYGDDLASTSLIASDKQVLFMPAMNVEMWQNKINKANVIKLQNSGVEFIGPEYGYLACKERGFGRLSNEKKVVESIIDYLNKNQILNKINCIITAGPTQEPIDPIRYITNHSSGKQGFEIAKQLMLKGANVKLITGPTDLQPPPNVKTIKIKTAKEMYDEVKKNLNADVAIFTAAVSDVRPINNSKNKIKKEKFDKIILKKNPDIVKTFSSNSKKSKLIIAFAAETKNHIKNARKKLIEKKCDLILLNKINDKNKVFGSEFNKITIIDKKNTQTLKKMTKINVAKVLINRIIENLND